MQYFTIYAIYICLIDGEEKVFHIYYRVSMVSFYYGVVIHVLPYLFMYCHFHYKLNMTIGLINLSDHNMPTLSLHHI